MAVHEKVRFKMEQAARYRVAGMRDGEIASTLGYTLQGLYRLLRDPDYPEVAASVQQQLLGKMDTALAEQRCDPLLSQMEGAVPAALQALVDGLKATRGAEPDLKMRMEAAKEVLDRDPSRRFAKSSRSAPADGTGVGAGIAHLPAQVLENLRSDHASVMDAMSQRAASQGAASQHGTQSKSKVDHTDLGLAMQPQAPGVN